MSELITVFYMQDNNKDPQGYEAYSVVYAIETWWVSLYIITVHLKHTNSTINQCPSWSLCSICRTTNKEPQGYEAYSVVYVIETWWASLYIITAHLKHTKESKVCRVLSHEFGVVRLYRTFSNHIITELQRCVAFFHLSSGWFDCTEPSVTTSLQGKQGVQGTYALVWGS